MNVFYDNGKYIELLMDRGKAMGKYDFDKVREIEKTIDEKRKDKDVYEQWTTPESCYITFESDDSKLLAL